MQELSARCLPRRHAAPAPPSAEAFKIDLGYHTPRHPAPGLYFALRDQRVDPQRRRCGVLKRNAREGGKLLQMLSELIITNFKCFRSHTIPFRPLTIVVGRNNAGKSTIVEALRLVSLVANKFQHLPIREVPTWLDIPSVNRGVAPSLENQNIDFSGVFHRYGDPPATIMARFDSGASITVYIGGEKQIHAVVKDPKRSVVVSRNHAMRLDLSPIGILPQISPVSSKETILVPEYVRGAISSTLASRHFAKPIESSLRRIL